MLALGLTVVRAWGGSGTQLHRWRCYTDVPVTWPVSPTALQACFCLLKKLWKILFASSSFSCRRKSMADSVHLFCHPPDFRPVHVLVLLGLGVSPIQSLVAVGRAWGDIQCCGQCYPLKRGRQLPLCMHMVFTGSSLMDSGLPEPWFCFLWFQLPAVSHCLKILNGKFQK